MWEMLEVVEREPAVFRERMDAALNPCARSRRSSSRSTKQAAGPTTTQHAWDQVIRGVTTVEDIVTKERRRRQHQQRRRPARLLNERATNTVRFPSVNWFADRRIPR